MFKRIVLVSTALSLVAVPVSAQTYGGRSLSGKTHVERAIGKCAASLLIGGLLGAGIGAAAGDTRRGALIGLGAGAVVCAVLVSAASSKDKAALRAAQLEALNSGAEQTVAWQTEQGQLARTVVSPSAPGSVLLSQAGSLQCRQDDMCRVGDSWYPKADILAGNAAPNAPKLVKASFTNAQQLVCRRAHVSMSIDGSAATDGTDVSCLVGDTWITGDELKKHKINEAHVTA
ncbi:hypothetical protein HJG53_02605 [Sphingomonas sp. ID1715]|uniref:hypothetical protein n=1 Tax=Sphingomonas sp. ID1715 TaxID=1656898 RepID=UPI0014899B31|nr:hypothetical protein [Sphingomonas sp. ID1715]NNM75797.1 hypothetical protein [Sphingomonas sp. ID1715]